MAFLFILGQALPAHFVGGCGARAVSRKTPIYFIFKSFPNQELIEQMHTLRNTLSGLRNPESGCHENIGVCVGDMCVGKEVSCFKGATRLLLSYPIIN